jgi:hypothetical protein
MEKRKIEMTKEYKAIEFEFENILQENKYNREEDLAHIKGQYALADTDQPGDLDLSPLDVEKSMLDRDALMQKAQEGKEKIGVEREKIAADERKSKRDTDAKKYAADKTLQVAKENKNQFDSPSKGKKDK